MNILFPIIGLDIDEFQLSYFCTISFPYCSTKSLFQK